MTPTMPRSLRITEKRRSVPPRTPAEKAVRDAQAAASDAEKSTHDPRDPEINCIAAETHLDQAAENLRQGSTPRARKTVEDAREYVGAVCARYPENDPEEDAMELPEDPLSDEECHGAQLVLQDAEEEIASAPRGATREHEALAAARKHIEKWCGR